MLYKVHAKVHEPRMKAFFTALVDGTIASQEPDGKAIQNAMQNAKLQSDGSIMWYEVCHCSTPLKHERETVYDRFLYDIEIIVVNNREDEIEGSSFWDYLENKYYDKTYSY